MLKHKEVVTWHWAHDLHLIDLVTFEDPNLRCQRMSNYTQNVHLSTLWLKSPTQNCGNNMGEHLANHLSMKEGCLFCFVLFVPMRSTKLGCFRSHSWSLWKALEEEGCMGLVSWRLDLQCKSSWILNDFFTGNEIKSSWKFWKNWNMPLVLLERSWWAKIYWNLFGKTWTQNVRDIDFEVMSAPENSRLDITIGIIVGEQNP